MSFSEIKKIFVVIYISKSKVAISSWLLCNVYIDIIAFILYS